MAVRRRVAAAAAVVLGGVALAVLATACGAGKAGAGGASSAAASRPGSVAAALAAADGTRVSVRGSLFRDGGGVRLCEAIAESYPPQCGGERIAVVGLPMVVPAMEHSEDGTVSWVESIELEGIVRGGRLYLVDGGLAAG